jgi:hypothetical protein
MQRQPLLLSVIVTGGVRYRTITEYYSNLGTFRDAH